MCFIYQMFAVSLIICSMSIVKTTELNFHVKFLQILSLAFCPLANSMYGFLTWDKSKLYFTIAIAKTLAPPKICGDHCYHGYKSTKFYTSFFLFLSAIDAAFSYKKLQLNLYNTDTKGTEWSVHIREVSIL